MGFCVAGVGALVPGLFVASRGQVAVAPQAAPRAAPVARRPVVRVIDGLRVEDREEVAREALPAPVIEVEDPEHLIGETRTIEPGADGVLARTYLVRYEEGVATSRILVAQTILEPAVAVVVGRGTRPVPLETPYGVVRYVRAIEVLATYYTPRDGGKAPDDPWYGRTATGAVATRGVVAVDPRVIPLYSWLYVPGYGLARALDRGGAIIGNRIDVAFDDGDGAWWGRRRLIVYLLAGPASR